MNYNLPVSSVHGILQARILGWVAIPFSRGSSQPRDWTRVSHIAGKFLTIWATRKAQRDGFIIIKWELRVKFCDFVHVIWRPLCTCGVRPAPLVHNSRRAAAGIFQNPEGSVRKEVSRREMRREEESLPFSMWVSDEPGFALRLEPYVFSACISLTSINICWICQGSDLSAPTRVSAL